MFAPKLNLEANATEDYHGTPPHVVLNEVPSLYFCLVVGETMSLSGKKSVSGITETTRELSTSKCVRMLEQ